VLISPIFRAPGIQPPGIWGEEKGGGELGRPTASSGQAEEADGAERWRAVKNGRQAKRTRTARAVRAVSELSPFAAAAQPPRPGFSREMGSRGVREANG